MNRLNWTLVLVPLALLGLLACQGAAFGDDMDMPLAPLPSGVTAAAYAPPVPAAPAVPTAPSVTVTTPCGACDEGCGCGCDRHWIVGIEALWLAPIGNQRLAGFQTTDHDPLVTDTCIQEEMTFTPRITFGWQGECWGVQAQYFHFAKMTRSTATASSAPATAVATGPSRLPPSVASNSIWKSRGCSATAKPSSSLPAASATASSTSWPRCRSCSRTRAVTSTVGRCPSSISTAWA